MVVMGESTSRETAIAAMAEAANAHISDREHTFDGKPTGWRVCACGAIDKDGTHRTAMTWAALLASARVIPIEEHEAALAERDELRDAYAGLREDRLAQWQKRQDVEAALVVEQAKVAAHREVERPNWDTSTVCACGERFKSRCEHAFHRNRFLDAALADTQHPSTPGGGE